MNQPSSKGMNPALMGLAGVVAGVVAGILLAPKSGKETRKDLADLAERMKNDVVSRMQKMKDVTKETYQDVVNKVTEKYQETKEITAEEADNLKNEFDKNYEQIKEASAKDSKQPK